MQMLCLCVQAFSTKEIIGFTIGSISSVLYLCSRLPQMHTNVSLKKGSGGVGKEVNEYWMDRSFLKWRQTYL